MLIDSGYQLHGGQFMKAFLIFEIVVYSFCSCFMCFGCTWLYYFKREKEV